ncbi:hypothetical protein BH23BAC1_BH23BAC1_40000 [soil metagenome]
MFIKSSIVRYITFRFANAITLFPFVLVDKDVKLTRRLVQHEKIHLWQQAELLVIPFYFLYLIHYLINLIKYQSAYKAYKNIVFEKECYLNETVSNYLETRRFCGWFKYL